MVTLDVQNVGKRFAMELFSGVGLHAQTGQKIALIGDNGSGKSTFLRMLAGKESVEKGTIGWSRDVKIGYLEQEIGEETLSGGEKKILRLAELFYGNYDVVLLDEPDNHLDSEHKEWFENLVNEYAGLVIVISHDRHFLETDVHVIWNLDEHTIRAYPFGYGKFKQIYEGERESREHVWQTQEKERVRLEDAVRRFRVMAAANSKLAGRYRGMVKRYEKWVAEMVTKPAEDKKLELKVVLGKLHKRKTAIYMQEVNFHVFCGEKIAIVGPNGVGKTTLLKAMVGKNRDNSLKIGYYAQEHLEALDEHLSLVEELQKTHAFPYYDAIAYLKRFKFDEYLIKSEVRFLSGGQKSRLQLAKFLATNPDVLILDEPTNHLDLKTVLALEGFLREYAGALILVSHDRQLVENVVDKKYRLEGGKLI